MEHQDPVKHQKQKHGWKRKFSKTLNLTLFRPMDFSIKFDMFKSGWSIVYIEGLQVINFKKEHISFSEDWFCLSKQCRPWSNAALCCISSRSSLFAKVPYKCFFRFWVKEGFRNSKCKLSVCQQEMNVFKMKCSIVLNASEINQKNYHNLPNSEFVKSAFSESKV